MLVSQPEQRPAGEQNTVLDLARPDQLLQLVWRVDDVEVERTQEAEGCWYGRWGVNYIYGTWQVLQGLKAIDFPMDHVFGSGLVLILKMRL